MDKQFDELKHSGQLPSPSSVGMRILDVTSQDDWSIDQLVGVMRADPALSGRIIRVSNSALRSGAERVSSVQGAAMRIGVKTVRTVALGFTLISGNRTGRCERFDYDSFWSDALINAVAAQAISRDLGICDSAEAYTCALLGRTGELALATVHPEEYSELLERVAADPSLELAALEMQRFEIDHHQVGMALVADWGLPEHFAEAIGWYRRTYETSKHQSKATQNLVHVLRIARGLSTYFLAGELDQTKHWNQIQKLREKLKIDAESFAGLCDSIQAEWREWGSILEIGVRETRTMAAIGVSASKPGPEPTKEREAEGTGMLVLAVDDDPVALRVLERHLERAGHSVVTARDGREALKIALERNPHLVVTDWMMPEMDGLELCRALRRYRSGRTKYVIIVTGREEEDRVVEAFEAGVDDYVTKPFKPRLLTARIRAGMRVIRLQQQVEDEKKSQIESVAKLSVMARKLRAATLTDPLTELPNRRYAMKRLAEEWSSSQRTGNPLSVVMLDIDHFKQVNDTFGHDAGDRILVETARIMQDVTRGGDACARIGGEEFLVICPNTGTDGALLCAERMRSAVAANVVRLGGEDVEVTISLGIATVTPGMDDIDTLLKAADSAVYEAKRSGRNRTVVGDWGESQRLGA